MLHAPTVYSPSSVFACAGGETVTLDMGSIGVFIARVNGAIIVAFRGRSPLTAGEWLFAADCGSGEDEVGTFGRIHSSFRTVLGLDIDLRSLSQGHIRQGSCSGRRTCYLSKAGCLRKAVQRLIDL